MIKTPSGEFRVMIDKLHYISLKFLSAITIAIVVIAANTVIAAERVVKTVAGDLVLEVEGQTGNCFILLNNISILTLDCNGAYPPKILKHYKGKLGSFEDVWILQEIPMGNACNGGPLHIIGLRKDRSYSVSEPIDFCGGKSPEIKLELNRILIVLPGGLANRGTEAVPTEKWIYDNGNITKID